jgi:hypothetical protein
MFETTIELARRSSNLQARTLQVFEHRARDAQEKLSESVQAAVADSVSDVISPSLLPWQLALSWYEYATDFCQRSVLFWDTMRRRGNQSVARELAGKPPVLHFDYEMVLDARTFEQPVNYALVSITPPTGVTVDAKRRPYIMIDPRAGHGPGIGGFKDDSQVGVALKAGHPVYFVIFFPEPEPGQTLLDVCAAEQQFVRRVRELHPESAKPVLIGNCQGGWAAMMLAASSVEDTGPIVISGAPMSYWGGAWTEGSGNNPMRYSGGLLGGTWLASFASDMGNGVFDGAYLVQNFESLDPANSLWDKYYHVFANADTEPPRFLDFERWWSGYYLMNREEIEWITQNLFVGNDLWTGGVRMGGEAFDLREMRSPIIMFASMGDNITPPQQAFNWVADVYGSTEEIKARGQVIIGLLHQTAGHLALFVSGKVAKREHAQLVSVLKSVEALQPGLYGMQIEENKRKDGSIEYEVTFVEHRLEEISERVNRFERVDEKPFLAVKAVSEFNQLGYQLFLQPLVRAFSSDLTARLGRLFHPLRVQSWACSDLNPALWWLESAADLVKAQRRAVDTTNPWRKQEKVLAGVVSAGLDTYRDVRDAATEALFFEIYGNLYFSHFGDPAQQRKPSAAPADPRLLPFVKAALDAPEAGGYPAALARVGELLERQGAAVPLSRIELKASLVKEYADLLPDLPVHEWKLIRGQQDILVRFDPERAMATLPRLLADPVDRERFLQVLERLVNDRRLAAELSPEQLETVKRIRKALPTNKKAGGRRPNPDEATA